jgi:hypothetical protein
MNRGFLPFLFLCTHAAGRLLGRNGASVAALAAKAILSHRKSLEIAHQQVRFRGHDFAFSSRITAQGELVIELDVGDPSLGDRIVLEEELRTATRKVRGIAQEARLQRKPGHRPGR